MRRHASLADQSVQVAGAEAMCCPQLRFSSTREVQQDSGLAAEVRSGDFGRQRTHVEVRPSRRIEVRLIRDANDTPTSTGTERMSAKLSPFAVAPGRRDAPNNIAESGEPRTTSSAAWRKVVRRKPPLPMVALFCHAYNFLKTDEASQCS
jgi:hypothetical protein